MTQFDISFDSETGGFIGTEQDKPRVRQTSAVAYQQIKDEGLLSKLQEQVYRTLYRNGPLTATEVFLSMGIAKHGQGAVTPRFAELKRAGVIQEVGVRTCSVTGRNVIEWDVTDQLPRKVSRKERKVSKSEIVKDLKWIQYEIDRLKQTDIKCEIGKVIEKIEKL